MSDLAAANLRGPVVLCETDQVDRHLTTIESFRSDGVRIGVWYRNPDSSEWSIVRRFDENGRLLFEEHTNGPFRTLAYRYDANGRLSRVDALAPDAAEHVHESYVYHVDGTNTITLYIEPALRALNIAVSVSTESMMHTSLDAVCIMTIRDRQDRPVKKVLYDADDRVIHRVHFRYNDAGQLIEAGEEESGDRVRADRRSLYRYDALGRRIQAEMFCTWGGQRMEMSYNQLGDLTEERITPFAGEIDLGVEREPWSTHYTYDYDSRGNWTTRIDQIRRATGEVTHTGTTKRVLKYST